MHCTDEGQKASNSCSGMKSSLILDHIWGIKEGFAWLYQLCQNGKQFSYFAICDGSTHVNTFCSKKALLCYSFILMHSIDWIKESMLVSCCWGNFSNLKLNVNWQSQICFIAYKELQVIFASVSFQSWPYTKVGNTLTKIWPVQQGQAEIFDPCMGRLIVDRSTWVPQACLIFHIRLLPAAIATSINNCVLLVYMLYVYISIYTYMH